MTTATLEPSAPVALATLFVPLIPRRPSTAMGVEGDEWSRWVWRVSRFARFRGFKRVDQPCRIVATVRIPVSASRPVLESPQLDRWRDGVERAAILTGLVREWNLRGVEVVYEPLFDVPLKDQPVVEGTEFAFYSLEDQ